MSNDQSASEVGRYARQNTEFLSRILAYGDEEARAYALAMLANGDSIEAIEEVQTELEEIRRNLR